MEMCNESESDCEFDLVELQHEDATIYIANGSLELVEAVSDALAILSGLQGCFVRKESRICGTLLSLVDFEPLLPLLASAEAAVPVQQDRGVQHSVEMFFLPPEDVQSRICSRVCADN